MMPIRSLVLARFRARFLAPAALLVATAVSVEAQSNLSVQGYGYPTGQFSARAQGTGGAIAESDPLSPVNPASIGAFQNRILFFQMEPEFRSVKTPNGSERTSVARYPVVFGALPLGNKFVVGVGSSTFLDRTATTTFETSQILTATDTVPMTTTFNVNGAMNDVRFAAAWVPYRWLRVGAAMHAITGHNLVNITQQFEDTIRFASFAQQNIIGFSGSAFSTGVNLVSSNFSLSASARIGGSVRVAIEDTILGKANIPNRLGASVAYLGITNSVIAVRTAYENWSVLRGLGDPGPSGIDGWDTSLGADIAGPRIASRLIYFRAGARTRTLPFQAAGNTVKENSVSGGLGTTFANGRVMSDLSLIRANRSADIGATEKAWTVSFGISVRP